YVLPEAGQRNRLLPVIEHSVGCTNRHPPIALYVPCESESRGKQSPTVAVDAPAALVLRIAREDHSRRCVDVDLTAYTLIGESLVVMNKPAVFAVNREVRFPPDPVVHSQPRRQFPGILTVEANVVLTIPVC